MYPSKNDLKSLSVRGYVIGDKIGQGTYADVYSAKHISPYSDTELHLACKIFNNDKVPKDFSQKFFPREMEMLRNLDHPNVIRVHSIIQIGSLIYTFTVLAKNGDLLEYIKTKGYVPEFQARIWFKQMASGLRYLHKNNIAHRDLKCENILITENFEIQIADFGFARFCTNKHGVPSLSKTYCGSAAYAAPEIVRGIPYNPKIADVWSLGVILFIMLNGAMPFDDTNLKKLSYDQMTNNWSFRTRVSHTISKTAKSVVRSILDPNVNTRISLFKLTSHEWLTSLDNKGKGLSQADRSPRTQKVNQMNTRTDKKSGSSKVMSNKQTNLKG